MPLSIEVLTSPCSFTCTFSTPPIVLIKVELGLDSIINLSDSSDDDRCELLEVNPSPQAPSASPIPLLFYLQIPSFVAPESFVKQPRSIVDSLCRHANSLVVRMS